MFFYTIGYFYLQVAYTDVYWVLDNYAQTIVLLHTYSLSVLHSNVLSSAIDASRQALNAALALFLSFNFAVMSYVFAFSSLSSVSFVVSPSSIVVFSVTTF